MNQQVDESASKPKQQRAKWSEHQITCAVRAVQRNILSQREAAKRYNIPRRTLRNHLKTGSMERKLGRAATLTPEQEEDLVGRIIRLAEVGMPLTPKLVRKQAFVFCKKNSIPNRFSDTTSTAGRKWLKLFLKRHPQLTRRKAQMMNPSRAQKLNKFIVSDHFDKVKSLREKLHIENRPECLYNMDEKSCRISLHHQQTVLAQKGIKRLHQIANEHAESVTVVGCVNAVGNAIPPMILFRGKRMKPEFTDNLPAGSLVKMTAKGYMTHETFIDFIEHLAKHKTSGKCLLVFDGAACHLDYSIVEEAVKHDIALYCLPSNTTHELQPLDKSVYRSFEHHWDQELLKFVSKNPDRKLNKSSFNMILSEVWPKCKTHDNIVNGFKATGLYPFDPEVIPEEAFAPSALTELSIPASSENVIASTSHGIVQNTNITQMTGLNVNTGSESDSDSDNIPLSVLRTCAVSTTPSQLSTEVFDINDENRNPEQPSYEETPAVDPSVKHDSNTVAAKSPFQTLIPTPKILKINTAAPRKKALNYRGQQVTKDLFATRKVSTSSTRPKGRPKPSKDRGQKSGVTRKNQQSLAGTWFCHACKEDKILDMRQCKLCGAWFHEICVGLDADDEDFECPVACITN
ncbi:uncharacterized protein LOC125070127 [Vanessa atalanta]|uniref:uncharacterized protein LOC125070127 n=1 Tax=Vanessa atalanta TaxID=42275 RepID=UPI001FCDDC03|nr:uncharacterized protein LOC125070127 [Vanessa atalanta]